jgi:hypothetical protein
MQQSSTAVSFNYSVYSPQKHSNEVSQRSDGQFGSLSRDSPKSCSAVQGGLTGAYVGLKHAQALQQDCGFLVEVDGRNRLLRTLELYYAGFLHVAR